VKKKRVSSREGCEEMEWVTWGDETKTVKTGVLKKKARKRRVRDSHSKKKSRVACRIEFNLIKKTFGISI
jgi:hypothetical protein